MLRLLASKLARSGARPAAARTVAARIGCRYPELAECAGRAANARAQLLGRDRGGSRSARGHTLLPLWDSTRSLAQPSDLRSPCVVALPRRASLCKDPDATPKSRSH